MAERKLENKPPIQIASGEFACPDCRTKLAHGAVPIYTDGSFLGAFDGLICPMCKYGLLSEQGYTEYGEAEKLVGKIQETLNISESGEFSWMPLNDIRITSNDAINMPKIVEKEIKGESITYDEHNQLLPIRV